MKVILGTVREVWGLFVEDGSLALGLIVWVGVLLAISRLSGLHSSWAAPVLFAGCLAILIENVWRTGRR